MDDFELELKQGFLEEAAQGLTDVEQCFLDLENDPNNEETINKIFRLAHNLKGSSLAVGFEHMGEFTHAFESFILRIKNQELQVTPPVVTMLLKANDHLRHMVDEYVRNINASVDSSSLIEQLKNFSEDHSSYEHNPSYEEEQTSQPRETHEAQGSQDFSHGTHEVQRVSDSHGTSESHKNHEALSIEEAFQAYQNQQNQESYQVQQSLQEPSLVSPPSLSLVVDHETESKAHSFKESFSSDPSGFSPAVVSSSVGSSVAPTSTGGAPQGQAAVPDQSIRVSLNKVENLINFVGEMVILQSVLKEQLAHIDSNLIRRSVGQLGKVSKEIQEISMGLRMVPVKPTFQKMQRIVRDTAKSLNKDIAIHLEGEDTELDKTVLERITDPLVHLVRNAADHGVEMPEIRREKGKPEKGIIKLAAYHKSGRLIIEIQDDGGGLNPEKLRQKALEKKIIRPEQKLTDVDCYQLIFAPGFSTKEQVTDISGRGVGMDVVRTNISDIGGEISIQSEVGQGTTFTISLPLTLAIIDAMIVSYGQQRFVIPLNHVYETLRLEEKMVTQTTELGDILTLRDEPMPIYRLGDFFGISQKSLSGSSMIAMVNRSGSKPFALAVDDVIGQSQVVIKQLTQELSGIKGVSGVTILGDGRPAFIVEPTEIIKRKLNKSKPLFLEAS
jgi:two-component system, chemotaxis family, sensor kinase CheA